MSNFDNDLVIIGAGPAGLTAAQYGARANLKALVIEKVTPGGQALIIDILENYPGNVGDSSTDFTPKSGYEFAMDLHKQAESFGAAFMSGEVVSIIKNDDKSFSLNLADGSKINTKSVIIATGCNPRLLGVPGEKEFSGSGVSYCATCDGYFFKGKRIFVIGGGDAACDEARFLSRLSDKVTLVHRRDSFRAQKAIAERTMKNPNIKVRFNTIVKEIKGAEKVSSIVLQNTVTNEITEEAADAVFIFAGTSPNLSDVLLSSFKNDLNLELDEGAYIITNQKMMTNIPGIFAAGDIRSDTFRQVITAAADGAIAAHNAAEYIDN